MSHQDARVSLSNDKSVHEVKNVSGPTPRKTFSFKTSNKVGSSISSSDPVSSKGNGGTSSLSLPPIKGHNPGPSEENGSKGISFDMDDFLDFEGQSMHTPLNLEKKEELQLNNTSSTTLVNDTVDSAPSLISSTRQKKSSGVIKRPRLEDFFDDCPYEVKLFTHS